jgi:hypothetical protein
MFSEVYEEFRMQYSLGTDNKKHACACIGFLGVCFFCTTANVQEAKRAGNKINRHTRAMKCNRPRKVHREERNLLQLSHKLCCRLLGPFDFSSDSRSLQVLYVKSKQASSNTHMKQVKWRQKVWLWRVETAGSCFWIKLHVVYRNSSGALSCRRLTESWQVDRWPRTNPRLVLYIFAYVANWARLSMCRLWEQIAESRVQRTYLACFGWRIRWIVLSVTQT